MAREGEITAVRRRVPIFALLGANAISVLGNWMAVVAIPWFVLQTTGSAARTGLTGATIALGAVLAGFFGGPVVDRLGFKKTSVLADLVSGLTTAFIPLLHLTVGLEFWQLIVLVFLGSVLDAPGTSARHAMIPELARRSRMPIERANSAVASIPRFAQFLGPPVSGILIAVIGAGNVLWVNAVSFAASAALVAFFVPLPRGREEGVPADEVGAGDIRRYFSELLEGLRFVGRGRLILSIYFVVTVANLLDAPLISVILPVYARTEYGSAISFGLMFGSLGAGALVGTVLFGAMGHRLPRRITFLLCFFIIPLDYLVLAVTPSLPVITTVFFLTGIVGGPINPLITTVIQEHVPYAMRGRVFGVLGALAMGGAPLGLALAGFLVEDFGLTATILGMGVCYMTVTASMFFNPALREMNGHGGVQGPEPGAGKGF